MNDKSIISDKAKIFNNVRIVNTFIEDFCVIGDDCDLVDTTMSEKSEFGRRNLIRNTKIGKGSYTGTNTIIKNADIGKYCSISWNVSVGGGNHDYTNVSMYTDYWYKRTFGIEIKEKKSETLRTVIGNDVWIGSGVNIINGVSIGDGAVIGAGSIVTKDVPPYSIVIGVPGKVYKKRFSDEVIELLEKLKWWNWEEKRIINNIGFLRSKPSKDYILQLMENTNDL